MRSVPQSFYKSRQWIDCKTAYLQSVGHFCERCKAQGKYEPAEIVHHKTYLNSTNYRRPDIALGFDNLEALCRDCHNKEHFEDKAERRFAIGKDGELIY